MRKLILFVSFINLFFCSISINAQPVVKVNDSNFEDLFVEISPEQISESVFKLVGKDYTVITAGSESKFNSMVASDGGMGLLLGKPVTWCCLRANRYTLEFIRQSKTYTMTYFDDKYKSQFLLFGKKTGRDTNKMQESTLSSIKTPSGNISYKEAKLIIECSLTEITTVHPEDFYNDDNLKFVIDAQKEAGDYHKIVIGNITKVWVRK